VAWIRRYILFHYKQHPKEMGSSDLAYNFDVPRSLVVQFSDLELSSDAGILLARQAEEQEQVCRALAESIDAWRDPNKITHSLYQLVSQQE